MTDNTTDSPKRPKRLRFVPLAWLGGAAAATVLVLGVNGTLASWSSAIITNSQNTATVSNAVVLQETSGATTCNSTDSDTGTTGTNSFSCGTINKYGGGTIAPGGSQTVTVTMKNTGTEVGSLSLKANGCTASGGSAGTPPSLCSGPLTVSVSCGTPAVNYVPATTPATFATAPAVTVAAAIAANSSVTCTFTVALPANASAQYSGQSISQPLVWTLTGA